jgi:hypothetical protein
MPMGAQGIDFAREPIGIKKNALMPMMPMRADASHAAP